MKPAKNQKSLFNTGSLLGYMAIDQYGSHIKIKKYPRKELLEHFGRKHAQKMYRDTPNGAKHVGYIVAGHWCDIYEVHEWLKAA
jgi:hypothetical protein